MHPAGHLQISNSIEEHLSRKTKAHKATRNWLISVHAYEWQEQCLNGNLPGMAKSVRTWEAVRWILGGA